jgi:hypothetical protein
MSETRGNGADTNVISLADRMYPGGPWRDGPNLGPEGRAREVIKNGIAKSAVSLFADERSSPRAPNLGESRNEPAFDPATLPGYEGVDPAITQDLGRIGINERQATELRPIYERAVQDDMQRYASSLEQNVGRLQRELDPRDVQTVSELVNDERLTPPEMATWLRTWGNHEGVARMLTAWVRALRTGRY